MQYKIGQEIVFFLEICEYLCVTFNKNLKYAAKVSSLAFNL